ncbi:phage head-tail connector protein [Streptomyces sp. NBC_01221]|uniref:phage head-tail connector protein n=1 Tax=Streptomyces sp. NBC_01221 TaxID=2903782 RepID=UPI002254ECF8|nr:phage head-tail connector protein [Streptomyces sp. NBC_01221]MCX4786466.1 phage head-tail connector protein [Streptomyces sp. NBC_01221]
MALLTLDEAKAQLDIETTADDQELQAYIDSLTAVIERHTGPVEKRPVTEQVDSRGSRLALSQVPAVSLTSITPIFNGGLAIDVGDLALDGDAGVLWRRDRQVFYGGPWRVVYVAGRGEVPATIKLAALFLLQHLWRTQYGAARGGGGADDYSVTEPIPGFGYAIPNRVLELLEAFKAPPGVA